MAGSLLEHLEGKISLGTVREVADEGGSRPDCLIKFLPRSCPGGSTSWVGNLGVDGSYAEKLKVLYVSFLRQVTGMKDQRMGGDTWRQEGEDKVLQEAGTQPLWDYISRRQTTVADWVALQPIL